MITASREELTAKGYTFFTRLATGLPVLVWNATFNVTLAVRTPLLERMVLELIQANVRGRDELAGYLGLQGEPIFVETLITMLHNEVIYLDQDDFALTGPGERALAQDYRPAQMGLDVELIYDPYAERYSYYSSEELFRAPSRNGPPEVFDLDEVQYVRDIEQDLREVQALFQKTVPVADDVDSSSCEVLSVRAKTRRVEYRRVETELWFQAKAHRWAFIVLTGNDPDSELSGRVLDLATPNKPVLFGRSKPNLPFSDEGKWINRVAASHLENSGVSRLSPQERDEKRLFLLEHSKGHLVAVFNYWSDAEELSRTTVDLAKALLHHETLKITVCQSRYTGNETGLREQNERTEQRLTDFCDSYPGRVMFAMIDEVAGHRALLSELGSVLTSVDFWPRELKGVVGFSRNASYWLEGEGVLRDFEQLFLTSSNQGV